jgi:amino acid transporter
MLILILIIWYIIGLLGIYYKLIHKTNKDIILSSLIIYLLLAIIFPFYLIGEIMDLTVTSLGNLNVWNKVIWKRTYPAICPKCKSNIHFSTIYDSLTCDKCDWIEKENIQ